MTKTKSTAAPELVEMDLLAEPDTLERVAEALADLRALLPAIDAAMAKAHPALSRYDLEVGGHDWRPGRPARLEAEFFAGADEFDRSYWVSTAMELRRVLSLFDAMGQHEHDLGRPYPNLFGEPHRQSALDACSA